MVSKFKLLRLSPLAALLLLGACTTIPTGPSVMVMPGTGKSFDQFRLDDADCRQYALSQIGGTSANDAAVAKGVTSAAIGAGIGALAGAAMGGGHQGAGVGAGMGLLAGSAIGASSGQASGYAAQRQYDNAYVQCMYAKGDRVPVSGRMRSAPAPAYNPPPPPPRSYAPPPPPPGYPPPPPPGAR
ncbi:MAG TPA: YMGG-like glycine zipper-containing protein [Burkholderiales bacterium]|nr:YMGG-like glycine zipper-containing protein [Burkholderiales bacterium]